MAELSRALNLSNCPHDLEQSSAAEALQRETLSRLRKTLGDLH